MYPWWKEIGEIEFTVPDNGHLVIIEQKYLLINLGKAESKCTTLQS